MSSSATSTTLYYYFYRMILYVGEDLPGTTSNHRRQIIEEMWGDEVHVIDFNKYLPNVRSMKSLFWRFNNSISLRGFNKILNHLLDSFQFDLIWVDKGLFLGNEQIRKLRANTQKLVFFTPDCFFYQNNVKAVQGNLSIFDLVITTKSFEVDLFKQEIDESKVLLINQGYTDVGGGSFEQERDRDVIFIGKHELHRELCVLRLAEAGIDVYVGGAGWSRRKSRLTQYGVHLLEDDIRGEDYKRAISRSKIGLGFLSKSFPELHTTRTFEIPYFGSVLATERNAETERFFVEGEVLFYETLDELITKTQRILKSKGWKNMALLGQRRAVKNDCSWRLQMSRIHEVLDGKT